MNYLSKFSPRQTEKAEPIRELVKEKVPFNWGPEHEESFAMLKKEISKTPVLAYYNPQKETVQQTDASIKGLGACLLQEEKPVYFASKALMETERGYVMIEIESLAEAWAVKKFHHFLYGCHFTLETDQKPLEAILSRSLNQSTPRLQCILIRTFPYNFTVRYIPGARNLLAGLLIQIRGPERYYQITEVACISDLTTTTSQKWQIVRTLTSYSNWWWACSAQTYHYDRMAPYH